MLASTVMGASVGVLRMVNEAAVLAARG